MFSLSITSVMLHYRAILLLSFNSASRNRFACPLSGKNRKKIKFSDKRSLFFRTCNCICNQCHVHVLRCESQNDTRASLARCSDFERELSKHMPSSSRHVLARAVSFPLALFIFCTPLSTFYYSLLTVLTRNRETGEYTSVQ